MESPPTIETKSLVVRAPNDTDVDSLFAIEGNREAMRYTHCSPNREATRQRLLAYAAQYPRDGFAPWTITARADGKIVGWGGLCTDPSAPGWGVEVVYYFDPKCWGRGFATELVAASLEHAFRDLRLPEVGAFTASENHASTRVLEKAGFQFSEFVPKLARNRYRALPGLPPAVSQFRRTRS